MSNKLIRLIGSVGIFLLLNIPIASSAQMFFAPHGGGRMRVEGPGFMFPFMLLKKLDLTTEQESRIREIMASHRGTLQSLFKQLEATHEQMATKFFAPGSLSPADLLQQTQRLSQLREQLMNEGLNAALAIRGVLTPEQLTKAAQLQEKMRAMRAEMRQLWDDND
ncbi:MAG: Spy/CpxP family protein refolding chaperone [Candidatus Binatia bacterium]